MNIKKATALYTLAGSHNKNSNINVIHVDHMQLRSFARDLKVFERHLAEMAHEDYWRSKLRLLKSCRFWLCATTLPFNGLTEFYKEKLDNMSQELARSDAIYPQFAESARYLLQQAHCLMSMSDNPLLEAISKLQLSGKSALLLKDSRFIDEVEILLSKTLELRHLRVITASQLRNDEVYDNVIIVGPMRWFPDYVITAPRAKRFYIVRYQFLGDGWRPRTGFIAQSSRGSTTPLPDIVTSNADIEVVEAEEILPTVDWDAFSQQIVRQASAEQEFVDVQLIILDGNRGVFLEVGGSELVIDLRSEDLVHRVKIEQLEPGLFLIVRERGSGDYIVPLANRLLGEHAAPARAAQRHWKSELRKAVWLRGIDSVLNGLRRMGARSASTGNLRNWMSDSERKIRPRYFEDFRAIMRYLELLDQVENYWKQARRINKAHLMAGVQMKKLLLAEVRKTDLSRLERYGYQAFALSEYETRIHAYRISEVRPKVISVPLASTGELIEL